MKSYTDLEQSKKLAEFLPIESADMRYTPLGDMTHPWVWTDTFIEKDAIPCWSLATLLSLLPNSIYDNTNEFSQLDFTKKSIAYIHGTTDSIKIEVLKDNLVDACVEMILKLYEQKLL